MEKKKKALTHKSDKQQKFLLDSAFKIKFSGLPWCRSG